MRAFVFIALTCLDLVVPIMPSAIAGAVGSVRLQPQKPIAVPGGSGFDWMKVDGSKRRLLAAHKGAGTLTVLDLDSGAKPRSVKTGAAQGIAIDARDNKYFIGDDTEEKIVVLDRTTLAKMDEIKVTGPVDAVEFDPKSGMVYADHDDGTEVWVIDAKTDKIVGSVTVAGPPEDVVYDRTTDRLYQNIKTTDSVQVIDPTTNNVEAVWPTAPVKSPHGLALDRRTNRLFTAGQNGKLAVIDILTGKVTATADIAPGVDQIAFDAVNKRIYCACRGQISIVQETNGGVKAVGNAASPPGAHTIAVDPTTHAVWICYGNAKGSYLQRFTIPKK